MQIAHLLLRLLVLTVAQTETGEVVIEGDASLVDVVLAAQKTNVASSKQGFLDAEVELTDSSGKTTGTVSVLWSERGAEWGYAVSTIDGSQVNQGKPMEIEGKIIREGKRHLFYTSNQPPRADFAQITQSDRFPIPAYLQIMPADAWYRFDARTPFAELLDPKYKPELMTKYVIRQDGDRIIIQRHYNTIASYHEFHVSLKHNGNIVSYDTYPRLSDELWLSGRFDWTQNSSGVWYVESLHMERSIPHPRGDSRSERILDVKVTSYNAQPEIAKNQLSIDAFEFPPGTKVEVFGPDGKLRSGRKIPIPNKRAVSDEEFSDLAETLRQGRFIWGKK